MVENASSQGKSRRAMASRLGTDDNAPSKNAGVF
jgi:hypothetical protein